MNKRSLVAIAVASTFSALPVIANEKVEDGWDVNGYMSSNVRTVNGKTVDTEYGRPDYKTAGTHGQSTNQVEFSIINRSTYENGVRADYVLRSEFGNGNSLAYSSDGGQYVNNTDGFALKEAYVELHGVLGEETSIWGGQRYLNRAAGLLSGEFWKQSSGIGAGIETKIGGNTAGIAYILADAKVNGELDEDGNPVLDNPANRATNSSIDLYYYGVDVGFGSMDFDFKYGQQKAVKGEEDQDGIGLSATLNSSYYGLDGWTQTAFGYGTGVMQNRGVNFGNWSGGDDNAESLFITSYGVLNVTDRFQIGSEIVYMTGIDELFGVDGLTRAMIAARPSYKLNDNMRLEATLSYADESGLSVGDWGEAIPTEDHTTSQIFNAEIAMAFTVNADYFGRPQIKPYVSYISADDRASAEMIGITSGTSETVVGVHTEIWF